MIAELLQQIVSLLTAIALSVSPVAQPVSTLMTMLPVEVMPIAVGGWTLSETGYVPGTGYGYSNTPNQLPSSAVGELSQADYTYVNIQTSGSPAGNSAKGYGIQASTQANLVLTYEYTFDAPVYVVEGSFEHFLRNSNPTQSAEVIAQVPKSVSVVYGLTNGKTETLPAPVSGYNPAVISVNYSNDVGISSISFVISYNSFSWPKTQSTTATGYSGYARRQAVFRSQLVVSYDAPQPDYEGLLRAILAAIGAIGDAMNATFNPHLKAIEDATEGIYDGIADMFTPGGSGSTNENGTSSAVTPDDQKAMADISTGTQDMFGSSGNADDVFSWAEDSTLFDWFSQSTEDDLMGRGSMTFANGGYNPWTDLPDDLQPGEDGLIHFYGRGSP